MILAQTILAIAYVVGAIVFCGIGIALMIQDREAGRASNYGGLFAFTFLWPIVAVTSVSLYLFEKFGKRKDAK